MNLSFKGKVLGKRKRPYKRILNGNSENVSDCNSGELNEGGSKRKHTSTISKAILAKKILNKIEIENNPYENVTKKVIISDP